MRIFLTIAFFLLLPGVVAPKPVRKVPWDVTLEDVILTIENLGGESAERSLPPSVG